MSNSHLLVEGYQALSINPDTWQKQQVQNYLHLLHKWGNRMNLTAISDERERIIRHIFDSLSLLKHIPESTSILYDIGSGAGLPGIPLAIMRPEIEVHLVDSSQKKSHFLRQAAIELNLKNTQVHACRVEELQAEKKADIIVCRAFSSLFNFVDKTRALADTHTLWLAMKGQYPEEEEKNLPEGVSITEIKPLEVPFLDAQRCLLCMQAGKDIY